MGVHFFLRRGRFVCWYWKRKAWTWWIRLLGGKNPVECCRKGTFFPSAFGRTLSSADTRPGARTGIQAGANIDWPNWALTSSLEVRPSDQCNEREHKLSNFEFMSTIDRPHASTEQPHPQRFPSFAADHSFLSGTKKKLLVIPGVELQKLIDRFVVRAAFGVQGFGSFTAAFPKRVAWPSATARATKQRSNEAPSAREAPPHAQTGRCARRRCMEWSPLRLRRQTVVLDFVIL